MEPPNPADRRSFLHAASASALTAASYPYRAPWERELKALDVG